MLNTQLLLVRHGETVWNAEGRLQGSNDIELNAAGLAQAEHVAAAIAASPRRVEAIYCSPLIRARKTGEIIGQHLQLAVTSDGRFAERGLGQLEGKTKDDVLASDPELWAAWASGGELPANRGIVQRHVPVLRDCLERLYTELVKCLNRGVDVASEARVMQLRPAAAKRGEHIRKKEHGDAHVCSSSVGRPVRALFTHTQAVVSRNCCSRCSSTMWPVRVPGSEAALITGRTVITKIFRRLWCRALSIFKSQQIRCLCVCC